MPSLCGNDTTIPISSLHHKCISRDTFVLFVNKYYGRSKLTSICVVGDEWRSILILVRVIIARSRLVFKNLLHSAEKPGERKKKSGTKLQMESGCEIPVNLYSAPIEDE